MDPFLNPVIEHIPVKEHIPAIEPISVLEHISIIEYISVLETRKTREKNSNPNLQVRVGSGFT